MKRIFKFEFKNKKLSFEIETGYRKIEIFCFYEKSVVLTTMVINKNAIFKKKKVADDRENFANLQINFEERCYSNEKIPNTSNKRENRNNYESIIISRFIDRSLRGFFENNYFDGIVQINNYVLSIDEKCDPRIISLWNSSLCCLLSEDLYFFNDIVTSTKINVKEDVLVFNEIDKKNESSLELIVSSTKDKIVSLDLISNEIDWKKIEEMVNFSRINNLELIDFFLNIYNSMGIVKKKEEKDGKEWGIINDFDNFVDEKEIKEIVYKKHEWSKKKEEMGIFIAKKINFIDDIERSSFESFLKKRFDFYIREWMKIMVEGNNRLEDERGLNEIRNIKIKNNFLPINGNAIFSRGDTKTLSVVTIGKISEKIRYSNSNIIGKQMSNFINHYYFLPYAGNDISFNQGNTRREIGHGKLIEKSFFYLIPKIDVFPYTLRIVSEVISSDGSSSQSSICSSSLALILSGVPLTRPIAGVSFGLLNNKILWDITALEDKLGEMDFKIAGTRKGICSIQLDTKNKGIDMEIVSKCLSFSQSAHFFIIEKMEKSLEKINKKNNIIKNKKIFVEKNKIDLVLNYINKKGKKILEKYKSDVEIQKCDDNNFIVIYNKNENELETSYRILMEELAKNSFI